ncbi:MAG: hypothetical protein JXO22_11985 [Phycisphaerae bacterium]|nr:hypothetical protein [Phycisphaerae bacterium]
MSLLTLMFLAGAGAGALLLMHAFARTRQASDLMLDTYEEMLSDARRKKREEAEQQQRTQASADASAVEQIAALPPDAEIGDLPLEP